MLYLLLSIVCGSMLSIAMRLSNDKAKSNMGVLVVNYIVCVLMSATFIGWDKLIPAVENVAPTLGMGMLNGVFYMLTLVTMQYNIRRNGVVMSSIFSKIGGLLVPLVVSIILFAEIPSALQWIGFALAMAAILMMNARKGGANVQAKGFLFLMFLIEGLASVMSKIFREWGNSMLSDHFLLVTFGTAGLICIVLLLSKGERIGKYELIYGALVGVSNFMGARFMLKALETIPAIIVYPSRSVCSIILIALAGVFVFKEKLTKRQRISMAGILLALVLLNV